MLALDGAPGGQFDLNGFGDQLPFPDGAVKHSKFCFIPTGSALGLNNWTTLTQNITSSTPTPFDFVFTQNKNELHVDFGSPALYVYWQLEFGANPPTISGPSLICSSGATFTAANLPSWLTWAHDGYLNLQSVSGSQATFTAKYPGTGNAGWIGFALNGNVVCKKEVWIGTPPPAYEIYGGNTETWVGYSEIYQARPSPRYQLPVNYHWYTVPYNYITPMAVDEIIEITFNNAGYYTLYVAVENACGSNSSPFSSDIYVDYNPNYSSGFGHSSYPNPASDILNIEIGTQANALTTTAKQLKSDPTCDIRLYDGQGNLLRQQKTKGGTVQFNVSGLSNGVYYLHIYDGMNDKPEMRQIVVEH